MTTPHRKRFKLRIKRLDFISSVDAGAQGEISNVALVKRDTDDVSATFRVAKTDESLGLVFGWAMASSLDGGKTPHVDLQGDAIESGDDLIKACAEFMEGGGASDVMHDGEQDGRVVFMMPLVDEVKRALGVESNTEGVAIAIKPSPETFKRFQSGELAAFSIGGVGERTPLEKSEDAAKAIAARVAQLEEEAELAKRRADYAIYIEKASLGVYLDNVEGMEAARTAAAGLAAQTANKQTTRDGASEWLAKNGGPVDIEKAEPESFEKVMKRRETTFEKSRRDMDALIAKVAKANNISIPQATQKLFEERGPDHDAFAKLYEEHENAKKAFYFGDPEGAAAPHIEKRNAAYAETTKMVEAYQLAHNIDDAHKARAFLEKNSTPYKELMKSYDEHDRAAHVARTEAAVASAKWHAAKAEELEAAEEAEAEKQRTAKMLPGERALADRIAKIGKERGLARPEATAWAMEHDEVTHELYSVYTAERQARAFGGN